MEINIDELCKDILRHMMLKDKIRLISFFIVVLDDGTYGVPKGLVA